MYKNTSVRSGQLSGCQTDWPMLDKILGKHLDRKLLGPLDAHDRFPLSASVAP